MELQLAQGDCLEEIKKIPDNSVDLILTDPPYNIGNFMLDREAGVHRMRENFFATAGWDNLTQDEWSSSMQAVLDEAARVLKPGGSAVIFMSVIKIETLLKLARRSGLYYKTTGTWHKKNPMPRNMNLHFINSTEVWAYFTYGKKTGTFNNEGLAVHDFIETSVTPKNERQFGKHPTQKPLVLMTHFIKLLSNPGDMVLDPFMGSGSTGVAALMMNRRFIGFELDSSYYEISKNRMDGILK